MCEYQGGLKYFQVRGVSYVHARADNGGLQPPEDLLGSPWSTELVFRWMGDGQGEQAVLGVGLRGEGESRHVCPIVQSSIPPAGSG